LQSSQTAARAKNLEPEMKSILSPCKSKLKIIDSSYGLEIELVPESVSHARKLNPYK
jgi:hypothetical protein